MSEAPRFQAASALRLILCLTCALSAFPGQADPPPAPKMILVEPGEFIMGREDGEADERPAHLVRLTRPIMAAANKVSYEDWDRYCLSTARSRLKDRFGERGGVPVMGVSWYEATAYCNWLSEAHGLKPCYSGRGEATICDFSASGYRLPTEAEWEWMARGGRLGRGFLYPGSDNPLEVAWFDENSGGRMRPSGLLKPNELGIHDLAGDIYEWCWDYYDREAYSASAGSDPQGPPGKRLATPRGSERVRRSGSWREGRAAMRVSFRSKDYAGYPGDNGFRLVRTLIR